MRVPQRIERMLIMIPSWAAEETEGKREVDIELKDSFFSISF